MNASLQNNTPPVKVGDIITLHLEGLAAGGDVVGRVGPFAVFVAGGAPSEVAKVEITAVSSTFARGKLVSVVQPSPDRIQPRCPHFGECGGCDLQHIYYPAQLAQKSLLVRENLQRIAGLTDIEMPPAIGMEDTWGYRNKAEYFAGRDAEGHIFLGFLRRGSHEVVPISECAVQHPLNEAVRRVLTELINTHAQGAEEKEALVKLNTRISFADNLACVTLITFGRPGFIRPLAASLMERLPQVSGVCHAGTRMCSGAQHAPAEIVLGTPYLFERIREISFRISPDSFFQVNPHQAAALTEVVEAHADITDEEIIIEGYSGVGTFLIPLAKKARMATGIEESDSAVADAKANLRKNHLENTRIYEGKVESILPRFAARRWHAGAVVLDPPRKGCGKAVLAAAANLRPRSIVIISCDPATLARDLKFITSMDYVPKSVQLVDMFPHTWHIECVATVSSEFTVES